MNHNMDYLIKKALAEKETPNTDLNRRILMKVKENNQMKKYLIKKSIATAACIGLAALSSVSVYAAYRYLNPSQVAEKVATNSSIAQAFMSKDAVKINETQSSNGYNITLLGLVSGKNLAIHIPEENSQTLTASHTYAVVAIESIDGQKIEYKDFCISPLICGVDFMIANNATMNTF